MWRAFFLLSCFCLIAACSSKPTPRANDQNARQAPPDVTLSHVKAYLLLGNTAKAEERFQTLNKQEMNAHTQLVLAELNAAKGDSIGAQQAFLQSINDSALNNELVDSDLLAYFCGEKKWLPLQSYADGLDAKSLSKAKRNEQLSTIGHCFFSAGRWPEALQIYNKAELESSLPPFSFLALARLNIELEKYQLAQDLIDRFELYKTQVDAETLWYSFEVYAALNKSLLAQRYAQQLMSLFPNTRYARNYLMYTKRNKKQQLEQQPAQAQIPTPKAAGPKIHSIQKGENLYQISKRYGLTVDDLLKWNAKLVIDDIAIGTPIQLAPNQ